MAPQSKLSNLASSISPTHFINISLLRLSGATFSAPPPRAYSLPPTGYLTPLFQPQHDPQIFQIINTIPIRLCIRDNITLEPDTPTEIVWMHDRHGHHELEVRLLAAPGGTSTTFIAPSWYSNTSTLRNGPATDANTPIPRPPNNPWRITPTSNASTTANPSSPYVDTTISPISLLEGGRLNHISHPASFRIGPIHVHNLCNVFQQLMCTSDLTHITPLPPSFSSLTPISTGPQNPYFRNSPPPLHSNPPPSLKALALFRTNPLLAGHMNNPPPLTPDSPHTWLPFLRQKYKTLIEKLFALQKKSRRPHLVIPIHSTQDDFQVQAHLLSIIHAFTLVNSISTVTQQNFNITLLLPNQAISDSFYQSTCQWAKSFTAFVDDTELKPPSCLLQLHHNHLTTYHAILYPIDCAPPSDNPIHLTLQLQSALFHILWAASHNTASSHEATQLLALTKHVADWTDNLSLDLHSLTSPRFRPRTFDVLHRALTKAQQDNLFFPEFFTHIDGLQVFSFSQSFTTITAGLSHDDSGLSSAIAQPSTEEHTPAPSTPPSFFSSPPRTLPNSHPMTSSSPLFLPIHLPKSPSFQNNFDNTTKHYNTSQTTTSLTAHTKVTLSLHSPYIFALLM